MLLEYLQDYTDRVKPLLDQNELYGKVLADFEKKWENGTFPGWPVSSDGIFTRSEVFYLFWPCALCFTPSAHLDNRRRQVVLWHMLGLIWTCLHFPLGR